MSGRRHTAWPLRGPVWRPKDGAGIDQIAFSYTDLEAAYRRVRASGVAIVRPSGADPEYGLHDIFIRAQNAMLVEVVRAGPLPDAAWQ